MIIECEEELIVIDTSESPAAASNILQDLRKRTNKTIRAIVYTHFHNDHIQGTQVLIFYFSYQFTRKSSHVK